MTETPLVRLVVLGPGKQVYGTRSLVAGDQFEMSREFADVLIRLGKARLADDKPAAKTVQTMQTEKAEAKAEAVAGDAPQRPSTSMPNVPAPRRNK
jgi:hypothetical protein